MSLSVHGAPVYIEHVSIRHNIVQAADERADIAVRGQGPGAGRVNRRGKGRCLTAV